jgi:hypothetical protein
MSTRFGEIVAIAAGTAVRVAGWCAILRAQSVHYVTASSCAVPEEDAPDHVELWVHEEDVERARTLLRDASREDGPSFW